MGLSSSQARLLTLTSRQHSIEYKAQRLEAQKLQLANDSDKVYQDYLSKLDAKKIQFRIVNNDGSMYFDDATFTKLAEKNYLFNVGGTICKNLDEVKRALTKQGITDQDISAEDSYTLLTTLVSEGYVVLMEVSDDANSEYFYKYEKPTTTGASGTAGIYKNSDETTPEFTIEVNSETGKNVFKISGGSTEMAQDEALEKIYSVMGNTSVSTSTTIQEISDEKELKKAEAQYEADMNRINRKDTRYDTELSQLETERNAIKNEIDTLKNVANDNVERTFKLFT